MDVPVLQGVLHGYVVKHYFGFLQFHVLQCLVQRESLKTVRSLLLIHATRYLGEKAKQHVTVQPLLDGLVEYGVVEE